MNDENRVFYEIVECPILRKEIEKKIKIIEKNWGKHFIIWKNSLDIKLLLKHEKLIPGKFYYCSIT